ncbi:MAG: nucleotide pyrophosphohydrolase [Muribaculaceae bacterium]|nr:nucleotide pyrophosphohydrolase [Muribaculaceae bacterium]
MPITEAQQAVDAWIKKIGGGYFSHLTNMALLTEEVGELARVIARTYGEQIHKPGDLSSSLQEELADVLWVVICLANQSGIDLDRALLASLEKKRLRDADRFASRR